MSASGTKWFIASSPKNQALVTENAKVVRAKAANPRGAGSATPDSTTDVLSLVRSCSATIFSFPRSFTNPSQLPYAKTSRHPPFVKAKIHFYWPGGPYTRKHQFVCNKDQDKQQPSLPRRRCR